MNDTGAQTYRDKSQLKLKRQQTRLHTLRLLEDVCQAARILAPDTDPKSLSILSDIVTGTLPRDLMLHYRLPFEEITQRAADAAEAIKRTLSLIFSAEQAVSAERARAEEQRQKLVARYEAQLQSLHDQLSAEAAKHREQLAAAEQKCRQLEDDALSLMADPVRRQQFLLQAPIHRLPLSNALMSAALRSGFYTLGDLLAVHPYELIADYGFTPSQVRELDTFTERIGASRPTHEGSTHEGSDPLCMNKKKY